MRYVLILVIVLLGMTFTQCGGSAKTSPVLCDTTCLKDSIRFAGDHSTRPAVIIAPNQCQADTLLWSYEGMGVNRKIGLRTIIGHAVPIQASHARCLFDDNKKAWLLFNDCATGRGYQVKLSYDKRESISVRSSGINSIDPKFNIDPELMAYTDRGNIYVEHMKKGTNAMMTFREQVPIDYDRIHDHIDSVRITSTKIWVRIKIQEQWKELEKEIDLETIDK
jgi:hypothetical protein